MEPASEIMIPDQDAKIESMIAAFLEVCKEADSKVTDFMHNLKDKQGWTRAEMIALQTRAIRVLQKRKQR